MIRSRAPMRSSQSSNAMGLLRFAHGLRQHRLTDPLTTAWCGAQITLHWINKLRSRDNLDAPRRRGEQWFVAKKEPPSLAAPRIGAGALERRCASGLRRGGGGEPATFEQWLDVGLTAGEVAEQVHRFVRAAAGEQQLAKAVAVFALEAAVLFEPLDGVGIEDLAPNVGVIAG